MRILIVEDEHKIANALKKGLEQEVFSVDVAYTGTDGYDLATVEEYDAIILDVMLPGMDGFDLCKNLREKNIQTPILILTAKGDLESKVEGLNLGADDYLTKPFAFVELLARLRALLRRPHNSNDTVLTCADLTLNPTTFEVFRGKTQIFLSKKEFSLLEYLMHRKNQILTKDQLASHVWDYDSDILPNTVEQYIGYLRNKIDKPFAKNPKDTLIKTVRGFGYMLSEKKD